MVHNTPHQMGRVERQKRTMVEMAQQCLMELNYNVDFGQKHVHRRSRRRLVVEM